MEQILGILIIAAVAGLILLLSRVRQKRIQPYLDKFAQVFCEASDHLLGDVDNHGILETETQENGGKRISDADAQPTAIRALFERGLDDEARAHIRALFETREQIQAQLAGFNLIGKKINGVLNRVYDVTNLSFSIIDNPRVVLSAEQVEDFHFFLNKQAYIRNTTLAAIVSADCKTAIAR